jgi:cob(I)alamin adenosyltransferase
MSSQEKNDLSIKLNSRDFSRTYAGISTSVTTGVGDNGRTQLLFGRVVAKWHPRIKLVGKLDIVSCHLNLAKLGTSDKLRHILNRVQETLVYVMAEVAVETEDFERFCDNYHSIQHSDIQQLQDLTSGMESQGTQFASWIEEFSTRQAYSELARSQVREAEILAWELAESEQLRQEIALWLNRLSDLLWALSRSEFN